MAKKNGVKFPVHGEKAETEMSKSERIFALAEKVAMYEKTLNTLGMQFSKALSEIQNAFQQISASFVQVVNRLDVLESLVESLIGKEEVETHTKKYLHQKAVQEAKLVKENLEKGVADGAFIPSDHITQTSLVVSVEKDKDGNVVHPGRAQNFFQQFRPELQPTLLDKGVGFSLPLPTGSVEIREIYEPTDKVLPGTVPQAQA